MFSVADADEPDYFAEGPPLPSPHAGAYFIRPGRGGKRYLRNVAARLRQIGFELDPLTDTWIRPKVGTDGRERPLLDLETLQDY